MSSTRLVWRKKSQKRFRRPVRLIELERLQTTFLDSLKQKGAMKVTIPNIAVMTATYQTCDTDAYAKIIVMIASNTIISDVIFYFSLWPYSSTRLSSTTIIV